MKNIISQIKFLSVILVILLGCQNSYSQDKEHQFSIGAGGVFSFIDYGLKDGQLDRENGLSLNLRYSYYLNDNWSIGLGAEYQTFNSAANLPNVNGSYATTDSEAENFEFRYNATRLRESQNLKFINIPINLQYEGADYPSIYASVGAKVGFAIKSTYETSIDNVSTSGYYPQYDAELFDPAFMGFGNFGTVNTGKQDLDLAVAYLATFEAGVKQFESDGMAIYIGLYLDYGINDILKKDSRPELIEYTEGVPVNLQYNSLLNSSSAEDVKLMAYGAKLRIAFN